MFALQVLIAPILHLLCVNQVHGPLLMLLSVPHVLQERLLLIQVLYRVQIVQWVLLAPHRYKLYVLLVIGRLHQKLYVLLVQVDYMDHYQTKDHRLFVWYVQRTFIPMQDNLLVLLAVFGSNLHSILLVMLHVRVHYSNSVLEPK